jgi:hypothetical protein
MATTQAGPFTARTAWVRSDQAKLGILAGAIAATLVARATAAAARVA